MRWSRAKLVTSVAEYDGQAKVRIGATQLEGISAREARRIVDEWVELLAAGPTPIRELEFVSRTPKRLFTALAGQSQLLSLRVKWGDFDDLSALTGMKSLRQLHLLGASKVEDLAPLSGLPRLEQVLLHTLVVDDLDYSPLQALPQLKHVRVMEVPGMRPPYEELKRSLPWRH